MAVRSWWSWWRRRPQGSAGGGPGRRSGHRRRGPGAADGYSTYGGLGIGLPGARRLMDEFAVVSDRSGNDDHHDQVVQGRTTMSDEPESPPATDRGQPTLDRRNEQLLPQLVAHLREHRTKLREEWVGRIRDAHLLEAMTHRRCRPRRLRSTTTTSRSWRPAVSRRCSTTPATCPSGSSRAAWRPTRWSESCCCCGTCSLGRCSRSTSGTSVC